MIIYDSYDNVLLETNVSDKSSLYCGLDNKDRLTLHFTLDRLVEIPIGSWCNFEGNRYEVMSDADVKMNHTENYDYSVVLSSYFALTSRYKVRNMIDRRLKFDLVAKPHEHLQMIVDNLNARDGGWSIGNCIDSVEKLVSYNHTNCEEALVNIADTFSTEIEVVGKVISLKKVEYFKDDPLALSYGKGNGFRPGIQRTSVDDGLPVQRLFVQGGSRNISLKEYGSSELHLPKSLSFKFDGNKFEGEDGFLEKYAKSFITDADGMSVSVDGMTGGMEDSLDLSEVYPSRVGKVTRVVYIFKGREHATPESSWTADDWNEVQIDIVDETIPNSLDFNDCLLENNESLTVIFQSGMLAGREFSANYLSDKKRFQLIKQEFDGQQMPQESFIPKVDDSYAVFNVYLPASYISDATTYSGAEYDMLREASRYLYEKCVSEFNFAGEIDGMWAKKKWETIGPRMRIGSYVSFTHEKMFPDEPALVRIVGITQYVNNPHYPKIELSNSVGVSTVSSRLNKIENKDAHVEELYEEARRYTKRRYSDIKQTIEMLSDAFDNYSEGINPITVETMLAVVGDKSLQYFFTKSIDTDVPSVLEYSFDPNDGVFSVSDAFIKHMTLEIDSISPVHSNDEYLRWHVASYASESLEKDSGYYLYAKVSRESQQGIFMLSKESIKLEAEDGYYNLLVGILNAEVDGERSFATMYGFTEVLPGQITTDIIKSADGNTWLDLLKGILHLNNMAGVSGVKNSEKGDKSIAAWFGGLMQDLEFDKDADSPAQSVIRHDGTGYFARGLFSWDKEIGINLGKGQLKINYDGSVDFGGNIRIGSTGEETLDSLLTIVAKLTDMWSFDKNGNIVADKQVIIKNNLIVSGDTASGGAGENNPVGIQGIKLNGQTYTDYDGDGVIDLGEIQNSLDEQAVLDLLEAKGYVTEEDIAGLIPDDYVNSAELTEIVNEINAKIAKKADSSALQNLQNEVDNIEAVLGMDEEAEGVINTWNEVKAFLDGYSSSDDLEAILSSMNADIAKRALQSELEALGLIVDGHTSSISTINGNITNLTNNKADKTSVYTKTEIDSKVSTINDAINGIDGRVDVVEAWKDLLGKYIVIEGTNVRIKTNLVIDGDAASGGSGEDIVVGIQGIKVNNDKYNDSGDGYVDLTDAFNSIDVSGELANYYTKGEVDGKIANFATTDALTSGLLVKVDKVDGKALSTNDFTDALLTKLNGIADGAEVNVQSDWNATSGDAFIKNKPTIPTNTNQLDNGAGYITSAALNGYATQQWVNNQGFAKASAIPTLKSLMGGSAIGGTTSYIYWNGSAWATKALGDRAFDSTAYQPLATAINTGNIGSYAPIYDADKNVTIQGYVIANSLKPVNYLWMGDLQESYYLSKNGIYWHNSANAYVSVLMAFTSSSIALNQPTTINANCVMNGNLVVSGDVASGGSGQETTGYLPLSGGTISGNLTLNQYLKINAWSGYGSGTANVWYNGSTKRLLWENATDMAFGTNLVIHTGNIGSYAPALNSYGTAKANAFRASAVYIECDSSGNTSGYGGEINRFGGGQLWIQAREGGLQLGNAASTTNFNGAVTMSSTLTITGNVFMSTNNPYIRFNDGGEGIYIHGTAINWHNSAGSYVTSLFGFAQNAISLQQNTNVNGNIKATGTVTQGSDIRFKHRMNDVSLDLDVIANAPLFSFYWNDRNDNQIHIGTSAQYWEIYRNELVSGTDFKGLDYSTLGVAMGISNARKTLDHESRIKVLEDKIKEIA